MLDAVVAVFTGWKLRDDAVVPVRVDGGGNEEVEWRKIDVCLRRDGCRVTMYL